MPNPFSQKAGKSPGPKSSSPTRLKTSKVTPSGAKTKLDNPWSSRLGKTNSSLPSGGTKKTRRATRSGISERSRSVGASSSLSTSSRGPDVSGVSVGDRVRITWEVDSAYAMAGHGTFTGKVTAIDDWITAIDNRGVKFHYPVSTLGSVDRLDSDKKRVKIRRG